MKSINYLSNIVYKHFQHRVRQTLSAGKGLKQFRAFVIIYDVTKKCDGYEELVKTAERQWAFSSPLLVEKDS